MSQLLPEKGRGRVYRQNKKKKIIDLVEKVGLGGNYHKAASNRFMENDSSHQENTEDRTGKVFLSGEPGGYSTQTNKTTAGKENL